MRGDAKEPVTDLDAGESRPPERTADEAAQDEPGRVARYGLRLSMMSFLYARSKKNPPPGVPVAGVVTRGDCTDGTH